MEKKIYYKKQLVLKEEENLNTIAHNVGNDRDTTVSSANVNNRPDSKPTLNVSKDDQQGISTAQTMANNTPPGKDFNIRVFNPNKESKNNTLNNSFHRDGTLVEGVTFTKKELSRFLNSL